MVGVVSGEERRDEGKRVKKLTSREKRRGEEIEERKRQGVEADKERGK